MGAIIKVFEANNDGNQIQFWIALLITILAIGSIIYWTKKPIPGLDRNRQLVLQMLLFFIAMIAGGTAAFTYLASHKTGPVTVYEQGISTPYGELPFQKIRKVAISQNAPNTPFQKDGKRLLIIESYAGTTHVLSEASYDIDAINATLRQAREKME